MATAGSLKTLARKVLCQDARFAKKPKLMNTMERRRPPKGTQSISRHKRKLRKAWTRRTRSNKRRVPKRQRRISSRRPRKPQKRKLLKRSRWRRARRRNHKRRLTTKKRLPNR